AGRRARAAALASGLEHRTTAAASHAGPEAVALLALSVVRLERALHAWPPSRRIARETRGRGPQTVGRTTKCTATRERTATRGTGTTRQCHATLVQRKTPVLRSDFSPTSRPRR